MATWLIYDKLKRKLSDIYNKLERKLSDIYDKLERKLADKDFLKKVMMKVALGLLATTAAVGVSILTGVFAFVPALAQLFILLGIMFGIYANSWGDDPNPFWTDFFYYTFCVVEGFFLAPLFFMLLTIPGGGLILFGSVGITALIFGGVWVYLMVAGQPKTSHSMAMGLLFGLIGIGILAAVTGLHSLILLHACMGVGIFTLFLAIDIGRAIYSSEEEGLTDDKKEVASTLIAFNIYLDILNIMLDLAEMLAGGGKGHKWQSHEIIGGLLTATLLLIPLACIAIYRWAKKEPALFQITAPVNNEDSQPGLSSSQYKPPLIRALYRTRTGQTLAVCFATKQQPA